MKASTDVGGTFTDYVLLDKEELKAFKVLTTSDPSQGILRELGEKELEEFSHGTTVAVNAIIQRKGEEVVFFTTRGFRDLVHIGRQSRSKLYSFLAQKPQLPLEHIVEVDERILADGSLHSALDEESLEKVARKWGRKTAVAVVGFLNSYVNPEHEKRAASLLRKHFKTVITSHELRQEIREYQRFSTAVMEGYTLPLVRSYIHKLEGLSPEFSVMQSNGGRCWPAYLKAVNMVMSGPAGGVAATEALCRRLGIENALAYDMGGTSADVSALVAGRPLFTDTVDVTGIPIKALTIDIESIGAGGGSIAWVDDGGSLKVGPKSAGSTPGPACYGQGGTEFTVSDANLLAGVLGEKISTVKLDRSLAEKAAERLCQELGMSVEDLAQGVLRIVSSNMVAALKKVSVGRGYDPRNFTLFSFGGAGPMHSCALAEALGIQSIVIPPMAGAFSALGIMFSPLRFDYLRTILSPLEEALERIPEIMAEFRKDLKEKLGPRFQEAKSQLSLDMRYTGQGHQLQVPIISKELDMGTLAKEFHSRHRKLFGFDIPKKALEVLNLKMVAELPTSGIPLERFRKERPCEPGNRELRPHGQVPVYQRDFYGFSVEGPCIIEEGTTTVRVDPGWVARLTREDVLFLEVVK